MGELFFQLLKNLVVRARVSSTGRYAQPQMEPVSANSHCNGPRKCVFVLWHSKNGQSTNWHSWKSWFSRFKRAVFICQWLSCTPFIQGHFWCHHCIPCPRKCGFWYTTESKWGDIWLHTGPPSAHWPTLFFCSVFTIWRLKAIKCSVAICVWNAGMKLMKTNKQECPRPDGRCDMRLSGIS